MTEDELVAAIREDPDSDGPRLVYADWLQQRGDPLGEHIALSIELASMPRTGLFDERKKHRIELRLRELGFEEHWRRALRWPTSIERGMAASLWLDLTKIDDTVPDKLRGWMVRELGVSGDVDVATAESGLAIVARVIRRMALRRLTVAARLSPPQLGALLGGAITVERVELAGWMNATNDHVRAVVAEALPRLTAVSIEMGSVGIDDAGALALATLTGLRTVEVPRQRLSERGASALAAIPALRRLDLAGIVLGHRGVSAVVAASQALESLGLTGTAFTDETMQVIADASSLASLRRLELASYAYKTKLTRRGLDALATSPHLARELVVVLDGGTLGLEGSWSWRDDGSYLSGWTTRPSGPIAERFRIEVADRPEPPEE